MPDPTVHATAQTMVVATENMVDAATSIEELTAAQDTAWAAHDRFIDTTVKAIYVGLSRKRRNT
ncbi:hypothetical protein [Streptomyces sp. AC550_RSS872]|uniref:hypothetical protein n=1 Tax=Streptomyces sp. AC550_RSS872 TaxID=2823689 RepID=UPI0020B6DB32|nr:hypothetical protein [Streptomyces sp. AC550_RSS872]